MGSPHSIHPEGRRWINLGSLEKVPVGQGFSFRIGLEEIGVFRQRDGRLFATQSRCPHKNGPLTDGLVGAGKVICPLHSKKYDLSTGQGPAMEPCLRTYPVKVANGEILLALEGAPSGVECTPAA